MLGRRERRQPELFVAGSLRELLPDEHVLVRVDRVLDLGWLRAEVEPLYNAEAGRASTRKSRCGSCWRACCSGSCTTAG
jgi:hypothetical protein